MRNLKLTTLSFGCALGLLVPAGAQSTTPPANDSTTQAAGAITAAPATQVPTEKPEAADAAQAPPGNPTAPALAPSAPATEAAATTTTTSTNGFAGGAAAETRSLPPLGPDELRLNFRNAPLESVLNYLSEAAGYIIVPQPGAESLRGKVNMWSNQPVSKEEAFNLLQTALDQNGYTAVRFGRTLNIYTKLDAQKKNIPVKSGNKPEEIPQNEEMVTQIIPVRFISAVQISRDLQSIKPDSAIWSANEGGNSLIVTDTQSNIRRLAEIIKALDTAISSVSSVKVFKLNYADAKAVASVIKDLFASQETARGGGNAAASRFLQQIRGGRGGGAGGFGGGAFPAGGGGSADSSAGGGRAPTPRVVAVSEDRSNSVVVNAPDEQMPVIEDMIHQLDTMVEDVTMLRVFRLKYADAQETADVLSNLFADSNNSSSSGQGFRGQIQFGGRFGGAGMRGGGRSTASADSSSRMLKQTRVVAVPDLRTGSVIVSASRDLMDQIEEVVKDLDSDPAKKQQVYVFDLQNTDPTEVQNILQTLFPSSSYGGMNNARNNRNQAGTGNQLNNRATQNQNGMGRSSGRSSGSSFGGNLSFGQ